MNSQNKSTRKKLNIIIVDDHEIYRKSLVSTVAKILPQSHIHEASNGKNFLNLLVYHPQFDLTIMDIKMPAMDGIEATRRALHINPDLKILAISMYRSRENKLQMLEAGAMGFLTKGGDKAGIKSAIMTVLSGELFLNN